MEAGKVTTSIPSIEGYEEIVVESIATMARLFGVSAKKINNLRVAVNEACINAMEHGNNYDPDKPITVSYSYQDGEMIVSVKDAGSGEVHSDFQRPDVEEQVKKFKTERIGGWGLFLMKSLVDEVDIVGSDGQGTTATLKIATESQLMDN